MPNCIECGATVEHDTPHKVVSLELWCERCYYADSFAPVNSEISGYLPGEVA